jgi:hypothetical protein
VVAGAGAAIVVVATAENGASAIVKSCSDAYKAEGASFRPFSLARYFAS